MLKVRLGVMGIALSMLVTTLCAAMPVSAASAFASPAFQTQWQQSEASVPNFWGPLATAKDGQQEPYKEAPGGQRLVQYFDKARMEQAPSGVTTGLLTVELKTGRMQAGDATFEQRQPARVNIAGDPGTDGPTYADLTQLPEMRPKPAAGGQLLPYFYRGGKFVQLAQGDPDVPKIQRFAADGPNLTTYIRDPSGRYGDDVYVAFADFINGLPLPISQTTGYPISPLFVADVKVAGKATTLLVQAFERRVLTYNPANPAAFRVEFGNIGQHYYLWRYSAGTVAAAPPLPTKSMSGYPGKIVYETSSNGNGAVYVMSPDGSGKVMIGDGRSPLFSPDGKRIAFYTDKPTPPSQPFPDSAIRTVDMNGGNARDEVVFSTSAFETLVRWSPSGRYIATNSTQNGPGLLDLFDFTTGKANGKLTYVQGGVSLVYDWSPDGTSAVWQASTVFWKDVNLFYGAADRNGEGAVQITTGQYLNLMNPYGPDSYYKCARFSPDGLTIAVAGSKIFFLSVPGQRSPLEGKSIEGLSDIVQLAWSPDGRALAVTTGTDTAHQLSIVDVASSKIVTTVPGAGRVDWSHQ